jgi:hypothetical protein
VRLKVSILIGIVFTLALIAGLQLRATAADGDVLTLKQNYPNPFNSLTEIAFILPEGGHVKLVVNNMLGQQVSVLTEDDRSRGEYKLTFDGGDLPSGQYSYTLIFTGASGTSKLTKKMYLVK